MSETTEETNQNNVDSGEDTQLADGTDSPNSQPKLVANNGPTLDSGYKKSRNMGAKIFGPHYWMFSNTSGDERRALNVLAGFLGKASEFQDLHTEDGLTSNQWARFRDDVANALKGISTTPELAALQDTVNRYQIPQQFIFDPLNAADLWMRSKGYDTLDEYNAYASRMGGSSLAACFSIFDNHQDDRAWKLKAIINAGMAIFQTQLLANFARDAREDQVFMPREELETCQVDLDKVREGEVDKSFRHLCRLQVSRLEPKFKDAGKLVPFLELDGKRAMTSLLSWAWLVLMRIKSDPGSILNLEGPLSKKDRFLLKAKHFMGLEGGMPYIKKGTGHH